MSRRIHVLPDAVANQIAAGEVVERPASVVKELVENALDAKATSIEIRTQNGGKASIVVSDDGVGMGREDALLCLDRHATSKIREAEDLRTVPSFGFRGEALPSIAAVCRFLLETSEADAAVGTAVRAQGGRITSVEDRARRRGTTVEVRNLFFNAPARAKFLKSSRAEARAITEVLSTLALANPSVAFMLVADGEERLRLPAASDLGTRVADLWGDERAGDLLPLRREQGGLRLAGLVQRPDRAQPGFRRAYLFVGGRPFRSPALLRAADRGYRTTIPEKARPWMFLFLAVPEGDVDVNVHPAKAEVRFRDAGSVEAFVEESVRQALSGAESSATFDTQLRPPHALVREPSPAGDGGEGESQMALFVAGSGTPPGDGGEDGGGARPDRPDLEWAGGDETQPRLWQIHRTWVLAETRDGLLIIDQHSAHERILFERLMDAFGREGQPSQRLLFPLTLRLSRDEVRLVEDLGGLLRRAGFEVEGFGGDSVIVHAVPDPHRYFDAERCFREMIAELAEGSDLVRSGRNQHEKIAMTFACKGAIKAGQVLSIPELQELVDQLFATELPFHDVHGRPTIVRLSRGELERKFGR